MKGTLTPYCWAMAAISGSSVETMIWEKQPESWAVAMLWAIIGLPLKGLIFLRGMRLLPPRAGMMQSGMGRGLSLGLGIGLVGWIFRLLIRLGEQ